MKKFGYALMVFGLAMSLSLSGCGKSNSGTASGKTKHVVAWSQYVGWIPWPYAEESGILKKWADANNVEIELKEMDYMATVTAFVSKNVDAVVITNMEMLDNPAAAGVDSTAVIVGDYSNGNDAVCTVGIDSVAGLKGQTVYLAEFSVSHYLLARALDQHGLSEQDVKTLNITESDVAAAFAANNTDRKAYVTWNPFVMTIAQNPSVKQVYTSAAIPGEILDLMVVRTEVLQKSPGLARALVGAWYEVMERMRHQDQSYEATMAKMADLSKCSSDEYKSQLTTTYMFWTPQSAYNYMTSKEIKEKMDLVRRFCFNHNLLQGTQSADDIGIWYPDGTVQGSPHNVKMRFDASWTKLAMEGKLTR